MPSGKSFFNFGLFRKNITRFWPIWGFYFFIWALALPARVAMGGTYNYALGMLSGPGQLMAFFFAPAAAMAVFSYLYKGRAANFMHALPLCREGLFLTNFLSGLAFFLGPNLLIGGLTFLAAGATGGNPPSALLWLGVQSLFCVFFYCFAVFCAMFTGSLAALPIFYGILNFLFPALYAVVNQMLRRFLFGFAGWSEAWTDWLWPLTKMLNTVTHQGGGVMSLRGVGVALLYAAAGLVLAAVALALYRSRHVERAGDVVSVFAVRPLFKYGVAFSAAVVLGAFLYDWLDLLTDSGWALLVYMLLCGALGYFIAEMLLKKSFRVWRAWRGCAVFSLVLLLACTSVELDLIGFERRVPENAASVTISSIHSYPGDSGSYAAVRFTERAQIAEVEALHRALIDRAQLSGYGFNLHYTLPDGSSVLRNYGGYFRGVLAQTPAADPLLEALINTREARLAAYAPIGSGTIRPALAYLSSYSTGASDTLSTREAGILYDAVCRDLDAGRIGIRFLTADEAFARVCTATDLVFEIAPPPAPPSADGRQSTRENQVVTINLQATATDTIEALKELGIWDESLMGITD